MAPFKPKGALPEWKIIYDALLHDADFGTVVSYADLDRVLGRSFKANRGPITKAKQELGKNKRRWLAPMVNVGYRVIEANEHMMTADSHKKRAKNQLGFMIKVGNATEITKLTPEELARFDSQSKVNAILFMVAVRHEERLNRIEALLQREGLLGP